jgi:hypothetical protein
MPSTYTVNLGIEKPATGEQSGTWGDTTNVNFDIIDQAINGVLSLTLASAGTSGSPNTLTIDNGATSDGRNKWIEFVDGGDLGANAYVQLGPNDAEKIVFFRNSLSGSRSVFVFQGTYNAANDFEIPAGYDVVLKFDGGGASATVTDVFQKLRVTELYTPTLGAGTADINDGTVEAVIGGTTPKAGTFTTLTANTNLTVNASTTVDGIIDDDTMATASATKLSTSESIKAYVDSQVGTVDTLSEILANGNTSGANNLIINNGQAITTNTVNETTAGSGVTVDGVLLKDDGINATNLEITNIKANDGTAAGSIANSTGAVTITSFISNSVDIGGGAIDGTTIGGTTPNSGAFTTLSATGDLTVDTNTLYVDSTNNRVGVGTSSPAGKAHVALSTSFSWGGNWTSGTAVFGGATDSSGALGISYNDTSGVVIGAVAPGVAWKNISIYANDFIVSSGASNESVRITSAGNVGIGTTSTTGASLRISKNVTGSAFSYSSYIDGQIQSDVTSAYASVQSSPSTQAAAFTLGQLRHFYANMGTMGAGSTVTSQFGFAAENTLTGATTNYGFYSNIAAGTGRFNFYAAGTADNAFAGSVGIGTSSPLAKFNVDGGGVVVSSDGDYFAGGAYYNAGWKNSVASQGGWVLRNDGGVLVIQTAPPNGAAGSALSMDERIRIDSSGNVGIGTTSPSTYGKLAVWGGKAGTSTSSAAFSTPGLAQGEDADLALYSTFENTGDDGPRRTADIIAGFNGSAWGTEYLSFNVGTNGTGNDSRVVTSEKVRITSNGDVGIGTDSPTYRLQTAGPSPGIAIQNTSSGGGWIDFLDSGGTVRGNIYYDNTSGYMVFGTSPSGTKIERMRIDSSGNVNIGTTPTTGVSLRISKNVTGSAFSYGSYIDGQIQSDVTSAYASVQSSPSTQATAFTLGNLRHFYANMGTIGAGSTVTNQFGFVAESSLTGATTNYGFYSAIAAGTGRYNFFAAGNADNAFAGNVGIGTSSPAVKLHIYSSGSSYTNPDNNDLPTIYLNNINNASTTAHSILLLRTAGSAGGDPFISYDIAGEYGWSAGVDNSDGNKYKIASSWSSLASDTRLTIDSSGNVGIGVTSPTFKLDVRGTTAPVANFYQLTAATNTDIYVNNVGSANNFLISRRSNGESWLYNSGADALVFTTDAIQRLIIEGGGVLRPGGDNTQTLGSASYRWSVVYAATGTINTSDEREKQQVANLDDAERRVAVALKGLVKKFKYNDAVALKGDDARIHVGVIAQEVIAAFAAEGLDATRYALLCHDTWEAEPEETDDEGNVIKLGLEAGERYGIRYDELLAFMIAAL